MKRIFYSLILGAAVLGVSADSRAENYVQAYLGAAIPHKSDVKGGGQSGRMEFDSGPSVGVKSGWFRDPSSIFGLQVDLNAHFPDTDELGAAGVRAAMDADVRVLSASVNAIARYTEPALRPYAGFGVGWYFGRISNGTIAAPVFGVSNTFSGDSDHAFGWHILAGVDFPVITNFSVFGEYKYARADFSFGGDLDFDLDYEASQIYGGVSYGF